MHTATIEIPRAKARELYRRYRANIHYSKPIDRECQRAYQLLAQGRVIIKAIESVAAAGLNAEGLPKLALCRADADICSLSMYGGGGGCRFTARGARNTWQSGKEFTFPDGTFPSNQSYRWATSLVPTIPLPLRPARALASYHLLWEADWKQQPSADPFLLRRIGSKADLWLVVAMWDLTEVERTVLASRIQNA